jgi:FkbM family methyltransferase
MSAPENPVKATGAQPAIATIVDAVMSFARNLPARVLRRAQNLGMLPALLLEAQRLRSRISKDEAPFALYSKYARYPLRCRPRTSDIDVFKQIFASREYRCLDDVPSAELIVDCGANVGFASAYFLTKYPSAKLIAVEPDPANVAMLKTNLAPYGDRWQAINSGVWSKNVGLVISEVPFGDGREWARTVRETREGETPTMTAVDIGTILAQSGHQRISILKVDIEGAETMVFGSNYEGWIDKVDNLVIELHGEECHNAFMKAIAPVGFQVTRCDELTVCKRLS